MKANFLIKPIFLLFAISLITSCKSSKPYTEEMKSELKRMYKEDQDIQNLLITSIQGKKGSAKIDSIDIRIKEIFKKNHKVVKSYFKKNGYPGIKENGKFTSFAFWIIVQHCDNDIKFQESVLRQMQKKTKSNNINLENYAYLYDRVKKAKGKKQLYGTQVIRDSLKNYKPYPTEDPENINKRRKSIGLGTIEEYLNSLQH